jgi:PhoPQ-activated pathogenicity-related protein
MIKPVFLLPVILTGVGLAPRPALADVTQGELAAYIARPEPEAGWKIEKKETVGTSEVTYVKLVSQVWEEKIKWEHDLVIFRPQGAPTDTVLLLNEGGKPGARQAMLGAMMAAKVKAPVAFLLGIPNQPLLGGKKEDDLIAETFVRYLETKNGSWPLLFPMVKSLVKGMDAVQEISAKEWGSKSGKFIVGGASKRGWTTWLTAASDPRVMAITPMVIDTLNFEKQLPHQFDCFGGPSEQIEPYTKRGLVPLPDTPEARRLWGMVDPWIYRAKYTMPKLIVLGNNDRYWTTDALNLYWDDLPGEKFISYSPNAGHNLTEILPDGTKGDPLRALNNLGAFVRHVLTGTPMPKLTWKHDNTPQGKLRLSVTFDKKPNEARLWIAQGATKDLRSARWEPRPLEVKEGAPIVAELDPPSQGYVAFYADLGYVFDELPQWLCTQLRMTGVTKVADAK